MHYIIFYYKIINNKLVYMGLRKLNNKFANVIFENVEKYRKLRGLSQLDLCRELLLIGINMYNNDIYRIEHNKKSVIGFELYAFTRVLKVTINDLLNEIDSKLNYYS